jgi:hypothetical protein
MYKFQMTAAESAHAAAPTTPEMHCNVTNNGSNATGQLGLVRLTVRCFGSSPNHLKPELAA